MKRLLVGLGNPGAEYARTRHNIGFQVLDALAGEAEWTPTRHGERSQIKHRGRTLVLLKPNTYMNLSGKAVHYHLEAEKLGPDKLLIITDDLALPFGTLRLRGKGSDGGHNGLKHINQELGQSNYPRLRMGIGAEFSRGQQVDYVLGEFSEAENEHLARVLAAGASAAKSWSFQPLGQVMTQVNKSVLPPPQANPPTQAAEASRKPRPPFEE